MRNPLVEVTAWLRGNGERFMVFDCEPSGHCRVALHYTRTECNDHQIIEGRGPTLDDALIMALDQLRGV